MPPINYPECKKCNEGVLLPFYASDGRNVYFCSNCGVRFHGYVNEPVIEEKPIFLKEAQYVSSELDAIPESTEDVSEKSQESLIETEPEIQDIEAETALETQAAAGEGVGDFVEAVEETEPLNEVINIESQNETEEIDTTEITDETRETSELLDTTEPIPLGPKTELSEPMEITESEYESESEHENKLALEIEPERESDNESTETPSLHGFAREEPGPESEFALESESIEPEVELKKVTFSGETETTTTHDDLEPKKEIPNDSGYIEDRTNQTTMLESEPTSPETNIENNENQATNGGTEQGEIPLDVHAQVQAAEPAEPMDEFDQEMSLQKEKQERYADEKFGDKEPEVGPETIQPQEIPEESKISTQSQPETIEARENVDSRLQNLLKEFELPVNKIEKETKIEIQEPQKEDKVNNIEVYKKLVEKYKSQNNNEHSLEPEE